MLKQTMTELTKVHTTELFEGIFDAKSYQETIKKLILTEDDEASYSVLIEGSDPPEEVIHDALEAQKLLKQKKKAWGPSFSKKEDEPELLKDENIVQKMESLAKELQKKYPSVTLKEFRHRSAKKGTILASGEDEVSQWSRQQEVSIVLDTREDDKVETLWKSFYIHDLSELESLLEESFEEVSNLLHGKSIHYGKTKVLLSSHAAGELLGSYASVFYSDVQRRKGSKFQDREGSVVASSLITLTDRPHQGPFMRTVDDEWQETKDHVLIKEGVLQKSLTNLEDHGGGSGYRTNLSPSTEVKAVHLEMDPGKTPLEELQSDVIYITQWEGLFAGTNPASGDFSLQSKGFAFRDQKKIPLKGILVSGNFYDLLKDIEALSKERTLSSYGGVSLEIPALLIKELSVIGEEK